MRTQSLKYNGIIYSPHIQNSLNPSNFHTNPVSLPQHPLLTPSLPLPPIYFSINSFNITFQYIYFSNPVMDRRLWRIQYVYPCYQYFSSYFLHWIVRANFPHWISEGTTLSLTFDDLNLDLGSRNSNLI